MSFTFLSSRYQTIWVTNQHCFLHSPFKDILVSRRHFIMQCKRGVQAMAKNFRNSYPAVDVEKIYKRTMAIISARWLCVELVSGEIHFFTLKQTFRLTNERTFSGLLIFNVIVFLSHMCHSNGIEDSISKRKSFEIRTSARRYTFIGRGCYRRDRCCSSRSSAITLASLNQRAHGKSIWRWKILSLHRHTISVKHSNLTKKNHCVNWLSILAIQCYHLQYDF